MAQEYSASASNMGRAKLPLIMCTEYKERRVVKRTSTKQWSLGEVFYCCPAHQRDGSGCPFFRWEEEYVALLKKLKKEGKIEVEDGVLDGEFSEVKSKKKGKHVDQQSVMLLEVVSLLKAILIACACILVLMLFQLFVILKK